MDKGKMVKALNQALAQEYACYIRYKTHASVITGPYAPGVSDRLDEIAEDEEEHAQQLRDRIVALGGTPVMTPEPSDLIPATKLKDILSVNIKEERKAIAMYQKLLDSIPREQRILYETIEDILEDEMEHLEELERLQE